ncbi:hypothetical protein [Mycoplasmopsis agassizii]|uniref:Lipoprotein n=1 Tax=Mycoplasmopsis agassizii TaxID=33922 RepID=A0ABX4H5A6_9BACT|nr:hypothetical protein [Mycoplasmopsis agassizii]PAF55076.1 hypothetical protein CJF60_00085 [Mycoplasmopsis agassizii]SMC19097.1 hypothetical protein SAMN02745179_00838 [Mycoplasmopsis agassizii]
MQFTRRKIIYSFATLSLVTSVSLAISCTLTNDDESEFIINTNMFTQWLNMNSFKFFPFKSEIISSIYSEKNDDLKPLLIPSNSEFKKFLDNWKKHLFKSYDQDKKFANSLHISKRKLVDAFNTYEETVLKNYDQQYFQENIMVVDFGNKIQPLGPLLKSPDDKDIRINNLYDISTKNNKIILKYAYEDLNKSYSWDKKDYAQTYGVIYSLNRKNFNIQGNNYAIEKQKLDYTKERSISQRMLNEYSSINQDISVYDENKSTKWNAKNYIDEADFATTIFKSKTELDALLTKYAHDYKNQFKKDFPNEVLEKIEKDFDQQYFKDNVLVLLSAHYWTKNNDLFSNKIEESFDVKLENNKLNFTIYTHENKHLPGAYDPIRKDYVNYSVSDLNIRIKKGYSRSESKSDTLFFKLPKSSITDLENLKSTVDLVDYYENLTTIIS